MAQTNFVLNIQNLCTWIHTSQGTIKAVDHVSLYIEPGETLGLVGESGSGKSVLSLSIMQLLPKHLKLQTSGHIWFAGNDLLHTPNKLLNSIRGKQLAMVFQDPMTSLNPFLTIESQLTEILIQHEQHTFKQAQKKAIAMLERVGIAQASMRIKDYPHQYSGGMRQRVLLAMALLCKPLLLIADEPTTALDTTVQAQILQLLRELQHDFGTSVLLISHDMGVIGHMAHRTAVMYAGRVVEQATTATLLAKPAHPYTQGLLRSIPKLDAPWDEPLVPIAGLPPHLAELPSGCHFWPRCPMAMAVCQASYPGMHTLSQTQLAACHLLEANQAI